MNGDDLESSGPPGRSAAAGLSRLVTPRPLSESERSIPVLDSLALPAAFLELVRPALEAHGFRAEDGERTRVEGGKRRTVYFTLVVRSTPPATWPLLYIVDKILTVFTLGNKAALVEIREMFEDEFRTLFVFHDAEPRGAFRNLAGEWESRYGVRAKFLSTSGIQDFGEMSVGEQFAYLKRELELQIEPAGPAPVPKAPPGNLTTSELTRLINVLRDLAEFEDTRSRENFLKLAGLHDLVGVTKLAGTRKDAAGELALALAQRDHRETGLLLRAVKSVDELPRDSLEYVDGLLAKYAFD